MADRKRTRSALALVASVAGCVAACTEAEPPRSEQLVYRPPASPCEIQLEITPVHPFLAEFRRTVSVRCGDHRESRTLAVDPGGLGRVEVFRADGSFLVRDAFESVTFSAADASVIGHEPDDGKWDTYPATCSHESVFDPAAPGYLGCFDVCDHRWRFTARGR